MINIPLRHKGQDVIPGLCCIDISWFIALERTGHPGGIDPFVEFLFGEVF